MSGLAASAAYVLKQLSHVCDDCISSRLEQCVQLLWTVRVTDARDVCCAGGGYVGARVDDDDAAAGAGTDEFDASDQQPWVRFHQAGRAKERHDRRGRTARVYGLRGIGDFY